jgi:hypothetical protein
MTALHASVNKNKTFLLSLICLPNAGRKLRDALARGVRKHDP